MKNKLLFAPAMGLCLGLTFAAYAFQADNSVSAAVQTVKTEKAAEVDYSKITYSDANGADCCAPGASCCHGGVCCKGKRK